MATNIPPHNLGEVIDGVVALIDNPALSVSDLIDIIPGPDFPTGGTIYGLQGIREAYETGRGIMRVRAKVAVETNKQDQSETVVVTELPYQVNKARLVEKIAELVRHKTIDGIRFVRDESDKDGMRIAIGLKKDQFADVIINQLYKHTRMENSFRRHFPGHRGQSSGIARPQEHAAAFYRSSQRDRGPPDPLRSEEGGRKSPHSGRL